MFQSRLLLVSIIFIVLTAAVGAFSIPVSADEPNVQISGVSVSPSDPITGEAVTIETTIRNLESSSGAIDITDIYIRASGTAESYERFNDIGSIAPGSSVSVPMSVTFDQVGDRRLTVNVAYQDQSGNRYSSEYPIYVEIEDPNVRVGLTTNNSEDAPDITNVELSNYGNADLENVTIAGTTGEKEFDRKYASDLEPDSSYSVAFDTGQLETGPVTFTATYEAADSTHTTSRTVDLDQQIEGEIRLTAIEVVRSGSDITIEGEAANVGGTDAESVLIGISNTNGARPVSPSGEYFVGSVDASEFATFELTGEVESGISSVPVEIRYIVDDERKTTTQQLDIESTVRMPEPGEQASESSPESQSNLPMTGIGLIVGLLVISVVGLGIYRWRNQ